MVSIATMFVFYTHIYLQHRIYIYIYICVCVYLKKKKDTCLHKVVGFDRLPPNPVLAKDVCIKYVSPT